MLSALIRSSEGGERGGERPPVVRERCLRKHMLELWDFLDCQFTHVTRGGGAASDAPADRSVC